MRMRRKGGTARVKSEEEGNRGSRRRPILGSGQQFQQKLTRVRGEAGGNCFLEEKKKKTPPSNKSTSAAKDISLLNLEDFTSPSI